MFSATITAQADTIITGGPVSGLWNASGSPYIIQSNILVVYGTTLTISSNVTVSFATNTQLQVNGTLVATGTPTNKVVFTSASAQKKPGDWNGIYGLSGDIFTSSIRLDNCLVEYATDGVFGYSAAHGSTVTVYLTINDSIIRFCSGVGIRASGVGAQSYNYTSGIIMLEVHGCIVYSNMVSGIQCSAVKGESDAYVQGTIANSVFYRNAKHGISTVTSLASGLQPYIANNVMWGNGASGIDMVGRYVAIIRNNIIVGNAAGISAVTAYDIHIRYNDVWGNNTNWFGKAIRYGNTDNNMCINPLFADAPSFDFHLLSKAGRYNPTTTIWVYDNTNSPCIDAGDPSSLFASEPQPNGGRINLGNYGNTLIASKTVPPLTGVLNCAKKSFVLSWPCAPSARYTVLYSDSTASGPWLDDLPGGQLTAGSSQTLLSYTNANICDPLSRFYRIRWNTP